VIGRGLSNLVEVGVDDVSPYVTAVKDVVALLAEVGASVDIDQYWRVTDYNTRSGEIR
jgi:hypothetical protein